MNRLLQILLGTLRVNVQITVSPQYILTPYHTFIRKNVHFAYVILTLLSCTYHKFFPFKVDPFQMGGYMKFDRVASLERVSIPFNP